MNRTFTQPRTSRRGIQSGFTIVELLIVIVIIGILAAIIVVTYNGVQKKAVTAAMSSDLHNAAMTMESDKAVSEDDSYSLTLPSSIRASKGVSLSLEATGSTPVYTGLNSVQNALLLFTTCAELVSEGVGARPADNHDYISECRVYSKTQFNVNGWNGR
ncbi:MAG TPA: prepilin-type N-terminal cleavage/methylation domain-containing protein, partial [Pseudomonadales bacterium]|nr:prepilin-type N-terminal cleavage/methylation domain-containing protein [Pseudomonadales bacterium]